MNENENVPVINNCDNFNRDSSESPDFLNSDFNISENPNISDFVVTSAPVPGTSNQNIQVILVKNR